jgi:Raf kinase inhibitor-like YbhB/YbcL family protein
MKLTSPEFKDNSDIPVRYTQEGENVSPPLEWSGIPNECKSFTLICEDPDAPKKLSESPNFIHWLIYNISPNVTALPEGIPTEAKLELPVIACQGKNSYGDVGYVGPLPPVGSGTHHYIFTLYACSKVLEVQPDAELNLVLEAMQEHVIAKVQLTGLYERFQSKTSEKPESLRT